MLGMSPYEWKKPGPPPAGMALYTTSKPIDSLSLDKEPQRVKALLTLASGQVELLQRHECLSGPKHPGVGGSDLSAHSSAPSSAAAELATLLGGS